MVEGEQPTGDRGLVDGYNGGRDFLKPMGRTVQGHCAVGESLGFLPLLSTVCLLAGCDLLGGKRPPRNTKSWTAYPDRRLLGRRWRPDWGPKR